MLQHDQTKSDKKATMQQKQPAEGKKSGPKLPKMVNVDKSA